MKTLCTLILIMVQLNFWTQYLETNHIKPSWATLSGKVDSVFQVRYHSDSTPNYYQDYAYTPSGSISMQMRQDYGAFFAKQITTVYKASKVVSENVISGYSEFENLFVYDKAGKVVEIKNEEYSMQFSYDKTGRVIQIDDVIPVDGYVARTTKYEYINTKNYTVNESSGDKVYSTSIYQDGRCMSRIEDNVLGGSDITLYKYNKQGNISEIDLSGPYDAETLIKYSYTYDERGNWLSCSETTQYSGEDPFESGYSLRKIIYSDGLVTGHEVQY